MGINSTVNTGKMDLKVLDLQAEREHFHQEIQLIYLLEGSMELKVAGQDFRLERDDIIVVNAEKSTLTVHLRMCCTVRFRYLTRLSWRHSAIPTLFSGAILRWIRMNRMIS